MSKFLVGCLLIGVVFTNLINLKREEDSKALIPADPTRCIQEKCPTQYAACQKDPKCLPALQDCQKKCGTSTTCWTFCLPGKGSQAAIDTAKCAQANGCVSQVPEAPSTALVPVDPQQCIEEKCPTQWAACQKDPKCIPALQDCEKKCGTKTSCWQLCLPGKGSQPAIDVAKCAQANNCLAQVPVPSTALVPVDPQACVEAKCPNQWAACQKDPKCLPAIQDCQKKCGTSTSCWTFCLGTKGDQTTINVAKCAQANGCLSQPAPTPYTQCMDNGCRAEVYECLADEICFGFVNHCKSLCGKDHGCSFDCFVEKRVFSPLLNKYFTCSGERKCI